MPCRLALAVREAACGRALIREVLLEGTIPRPVRSAPKPYARSTVRVDVDLLRAALDLLGAPDSTADAAADEPLEDDAAAARPKARTKDGHVSEMRPSLVSMQNRSLQRRTWSGWRELSPRPPEPHA